MEGRPGRPIPFGDPCPYINRLMRNTSMSTEIKFVTSETHEKNAKGETCYQAQLRHNVVLNEKETKQAFAAHSGRRLSDISYVEMTPGKAIREAAKASVPCPAKSSVATSASPTTG